MNGSNGRGLLLWLFAGACASDPGGGAEASGGTTSGPPAEATTSSGGVAESEGGGASSSGEDPSQPEEPDDDAIRITHAFGSLQLGAFEDDATTCVSWTLHNEEALYASAVTLSNEGSFHHSNWFVVPETDYGGIDGYWPCEERGYTEVDAAQKGTVLFAQSTQTYVEEQRLSEGAVVKIPPHSRVVAGVHTLNLAPREEESGLWLTLELLHPKDVAAVVTPLSIQYKDLEIPPQAESRFTADCDLSLPYGVVTFEPLSLRVHYILPHYHYLGNYFDVTVKGGLLDGQSIYSLEGFTGEANGKTFDPPLDLPGATGLEMTCGYDNWRSEPVYWGNGEGEMCVMLALVETKAVIGASVEFGTLAVDNIDGVTHYEGACLGIAVPKTAGQDPPTEEEKAAPLYLPPVQPGDEDIPPVPECRDADEDAPGETPRTLSSIAETIFTPACTFSACHGSSAAAGLDLTSTNLRSKLMNFESLVDPGMPLVKPGDPERSWLYKLLSECEPTRENGSVASHMPLNAPILLDDGLVAKVRAWIEAGAPDN
jgi:hypothetical protein